MVVNYDQVMFALIFIYIFGVFKDHLYLYWYCCYFCGEYSFVLMVIIIIIIKDHAIQSDNDHKNLYDYKPISY